MSLNDTLWNADDVKKCRDNCPKDSDEWKYFDSVYQKMIN